MLATALKFLFLVLILLKAPLSWGFSFERTQLYLTRAQSLDLATTKKWLKLGHYKKTQDGYESPFSGPFFLSVDGSTNPQDELVSTVQALFSDSPQITQKLKMHPQCFFLARRQWLRTVLQVDDRDILECPERDLWKSQLNAQKVALIFAASDLSNASSSFGHTFLKLINPKNAQNRDLVDYGVNYSAVTDATEGFLYAIKGLGGFYQGRFAILPYHQKIREYINLEGRDIWEYQLDLSPSEVDELVNHLLELDGASAPYYYLKTNCSYHILAALEAIRPDLELTDSFSYFVIPVDTVKVLKRKTNLISQSRFKRSLKSDYIDSYTQLSSEQRSTLLKIVDQPLAAEIDLPSHKDAGEVLETAMKYFAVKSYTNKQDYDDVIYQLSVRRARLGNVTQNLQEVPPAPPELTHDSSALALGSGVFNHEDYKSVRFRHAFHDLEQNDIGGVSFSHYEVMAFDLRYFEGSRKLQLQKLTFLNLVNLVPVTPLDSPISWRARIDFFKGWMPDLESGVGYSINISRSIRIAALITTRYSYLNPQDEKGFYQLGPSILFASRPLGRLGLSIDWTYFSALQFQPYQRLILKADYQFADQWDFQVLAERNFLKEGPTSLFQPDDFQARIMKNFLF